MEKPKFEDSVKDVFANAEAEPTAGVWTNIELELERLEDSKLRKRILVYKWAAAASLLFSVAVGMYFYRADDSGTGSQIAAKTQSNSEVKPGEGDESNVDPSGLTETTLELSTGEPSVIPGKDQDGTERQAKENLNENVSAERSRTLAGRDMQEAYKLNQGTVPNPMDARGSDARSLSGSESNRSASETDMGTATAGVESGKRYTADRNGFVGLPGLGLPTLVQLDAVRFVPQQVVDPGQQLLAQRAYEEEMLNREDKKKSVSDEKIWTSLGVGAGAYANINQSVAADASSLNSFHASNLANDALTKETKTGGSSYSVGLQVGGKLSRRWVIQGGLNYLTQVSEYSSNAAVFDGTKYYAAASVVEFARNDAAIGSNTFQSTSTYNVNSSKTYLMLPVMAGYRIIDRSFGLQLNTGISTDLFLQQVLAPDSESVEGSTTGRGEESPYRSVNFSGLIGTELSYRMGDRYRVALNPAIRYPFNSIYKADTGIEAVPFTFDVALRFNYIFR